MATSLEKHVNMFSNNIHTQQYMQWTKQVALISRKIIQNTKSSVMTIYHKFLVFEYIQNKKVFLQLISHF